MIELHELWSAKINHVLKSPVWEYEVDNIMTTKYKLAKFPNWEFELLSSLNRHELAKDFKQMEEDMKDIEGEIAQQNLLLSKPPECSPKQHILESDVCKPQDLDMDLVEHVNMKPTTIRDKKSSSTTSDTRTELSNSLDLEEDNYIPEIGSPEYALQMNEEDILDDNESDKSVDVKSISSNPMLKNADYYQLFLENYKKGENIDVGSDSNGDDHHSETINTFESNELFLTRCSEDNVEDVLTPITPVVDKIQRLGLCDAEGYQLTYFSDDEENDDFGIERSDSFDRFCRKNSCESSSSNELRRLNCSVGIAT